MRRRRLLSGVGVALALTIPLAVAIASPGSGVVNVSTRGDGVIDGPFKFEVDGLIELKAESDVRIFDQELTILEGGHTGWHSHPGPVIVTVKSGTFRYQEVDCTYVDYGPGQSFVDAGGGHVHIGRAVANPGDPAANDVNLSITYFAPPGVPLRIEADEVIC